jgi:hypothetical protein
MSAPTPFLPWFDAAAGLYAGSLLFFILKRERPSRLLLACGFIAHSMSLLMRGRHFGGFMPLNMFSELYFLPWLLVLANLLLFMKKDRNSDAGLAVPICFLSAIAVFLPAPVIPPSPQSASLFATLFFLCEVTAHALFILGAWQAYLFLTGRCEAQAFNGSAIWGFILYSIAQVVGAVWSWMGWAVPFHWSERHLVSAAIWCFYCAWLHLRFSPRWSARGQALFALCGALFMFVSSYAYYLANLGVKHG